MMDEDPDDKDDTKRRTRNLSEKKRRDQFNNLVNELSIMVSTNNRKMDKSTVLKSTIAFLKNHNEIMERSRVHDVQENWKPAFLSNEEFTYLVMEALEGFLMVFSVSGTIYYVSESIASLLGHNPIDILSQNMFELIYEEERNHFYNLIQTTAANMETMHETISEEPLSFQYYVRRGQRDDNEEAIYDLVRFDGHFRINMDYVDKNSMGLQQDPDSRLLFVCTARLHMPHLIRDVSLIDPNRHEFTSRHSLEWKFLFLDHRAPPIIGYLPFEVLGTSGYDYYHFDDMEKLVTCHKALMEKGELTSCYYRFLTKGQQWIWLQTRFYITYHQWNSKPEFVVCTHRVISYADIIKRPKPNTTEPGEQLPEDQGHGNLDVPNDTRNVSPAYTSDNSDAMTQIYSTAPQPHQTPSVKSVASGGSTCGGGHMGGSTSCTISIAAAAGWSRSGTHRYPAGSDTASHASCDSRSSNQNTGREYSPQTPKMEQSTPIPQHGIGAQYLEPSPYVPSIESVPVSLGVPLPVPVILSDQAQLQLLQWPRQEELQRKQDELQQMIMRQQEELRQVKEQLLLATLGILPPLVNVQGTYLNPEEVQQGNSRPQIVFEAPADGSPAIVYPPPPPPPHDPNRPNMPQ